MKRTLLLLPLVVSSLFALLGAQSGDWMASVPSRERERSNPFHAQNDAAQAGQILYEDHCASCHGAHAEGHKKRPSLQSQRVQQQATEGDLHWLLINGSMRHGMPSWARIPDPQLWQLVTYLKTLKTAGGSEKAAAATETK